MMAVLVVDDEAIIRFMAEALLHDAGHETLSAATVEEAIKLLKSDRTIDVLFTDLGLNDCPDGGVHLAVKARELRPELPVLYTSGQCITGGMQALFVEPHGFMAKPYTADQLRMALGHSLRQGIRMNG